MFALNALRSRSHIWKRVPAHSLGRVQCILGTVGKQICPENSRPVKETFVPGEPHRPQFSRWIPYGTPVN